ncbi:hypothetical protein O181_025598 [Austropuccinia psidii MF-1]|uniref:Uncharacterized protein n=1 Tax=Austropuccinia psidii MF-1 TaxID=1389203 RepID=A0A9Q3CKY3_9BASI|nr:hypothetical protein [Austropuccinia psidii MF-1]
MQTRFQDRAQAVLTPTPRAPLDGTPEVPQLRAHLERGPFMEGVAPSIQEGRGPRRSSSFSGLVGTFSEISRTTLKVPGEEYAEEEENSVEDEGSENTEPAPTPVGASQDIGGSTLAQSNQPLSHQYEPFLLAIMQQMTQNMANVQEASSSEASKPPSFNTSSMKAPDLLDRTQPFNVRSFIQSFHLIFIMTRQISLKTERKLFIPLHLSLEWLKNGLSLIFPISPIKAQHNSSIIGPY